MKNLYTIGIAVLFTAFQTIVYAQNPSDGCTGVPALTVGASCSPSAYTLPGTYANGGLATSTCVGTSNDRDDGWYTVTATSTGTMTVEMTGDRTRTLAIWSACGGGTELGCDKQISGTTCSVSFAATNGTTYYVQIHRHGGNNTATMAGTVCAYMGAPSGSGADCANANPLTPGTQQCGTNSSAGDFGDGGGAPQNPCNASYNDGEYWFSYIGTGQALQLDVSALTDTYSGIYVLDACAGAGPNCVASYSAGASSADYSITTPALTLGTTYYIVIANWSAPYQTDFCLDATVVAPPTPPANDDCSGAIALTVNPDELCGMVTSSTTSLATNSGIAACVGSGADDDVWFTFTATSTSHTFDILNISGTSTDVVHEIFSGTCPGGLTSIACSDPNSSQWGGFTIGSTYYVRVYTYGTSVEADFDICVGTPPPPPSNDEPCGATILSVNSGFCSYQTAMLETSATVSSGMPAPGCSSLGPDIWFEVTVPAGGLIIDLTTSGGPTDMGMAWYTGTDCNNLTTLIECDDDDSQNGAMPMICATDASCTVPGDCQQNPLLTPGTTVWVRVWEYGGGTFGQFDICAYEPAPAGGAVTCANATNITALPFTNAGTTCCAADTYTSADGCLSTYQDGEDFLYTYTPSANETVDINLTGTLSYTGIFVTDACPSSGGVNCVGSATNAAGNPSLCGLSLTAGTTYYIMVDTDPTPDCTPFNISVVSSTSPSCNLAYNFSTIPFAPDLNAGTDIALPIDDRFSSSYVPVGFNFCFDGYEYTQLLVSSNGYVIFDPISCASNLPTGNASPSAYSAYSINAAIPNTTDAPRNCIMFPWQDIDPSIGGTIRHQVLGVAPNRRFVLTFDNIPYYSCNSLLFTGQLKLYETTNDIEIHITNKEVCGTWNGGDGILGLHNYNGTQAVLGTNYPTDWTASNSAYRFTYNCPTCEPIVVLPVNMASFDGIAEDGYNHIYWSTFAEENNAYFVLENSANGVDFEELAIIQGEGNSAEITEYDFRHLEPNDLEYYRLKQVDHNGEFEYTNIIAISSVEENGVFFYPNPATDNLYIRLEETLNGGYTIVYTDVLGKTVIEEISFTPSALAYETRRFAELHSGVYNVKIVDAQNETIAIQKVIKK